MLPINFSTSPVISFGRSCKASKDSSREALGKEACVGGGTRDHIGIMEKKMETLGPFKGIYRVI